MTPNDLLLSKGTQQCFGAAQGNQTVFHGLQRKLQIAE